MIPHDPPTALIALLLTCPDCQGSEEVQDSGRASCCHHCASGWKSVALPLDEVLALHELPQPERYPALLKLAEETGAIRHPLLYQSGVDVPPKHCPPLRPNPSDAKQPEMRGIPLALIPK